MKISRLKKIGSINFPNKKAIVKDWRQQHERKWYFQLQFVDLLLGTKCMITFKI